MVNVGKNTWILWVPMSIGSLKKVSRLAPVSDGTEQWLNRASLLEKSCPL